MGDESVDGPGLSSDGATQRPTAPDNTTAAAADVSPLGDAPPAEPALRPPPRPASAAPVSGGTQLDRRVRLDPATARLDPATSRPAATGASASSSSPTQPAPIEAMPTESAPAEQESAVPFTLNEAFDSAERTTVVPTRRPANQKRVWWIASAVVVCLVIAAVIGLLVRQAGDSNAEDPGPTPGAGRRDPVAASVVRLQPGGPVTASQPVRFNRPVSRVSLSIPDRTDTDALSAFEPRITDLLVLVGGFKPRVVDESLTVGETVTIELAKPTREITLDYVARGVVKRSVPSTAGRATALVTPLAVDTPGAKRGPVTISGVTVLNAGCVSASGVASSCGRQVATGWVVDTDSLSRSTDVIAQTDMLNQTS